MNITFFLAFLIVLYLIFTRYPFQVKSLKTLSAPTTRACILLTMHANSKEREIMYMDVLNRWLANTNLHIFTVDSAASPMFSHSSHDRWKTLSFDQGYIGDKCYSKLEFEAIVRAEGYFDFSEFDIIVKITGKYFVPGLEDILSRAKPGLILQKRHSFWVTYQNSELYAFTPGSAKNLLAMFRKGAEQTLYDYSKFIGDATRFPKLQIETRYQRGDGSILNWL